MNHSIWKVKGFTPYLVIAFLNALTDIGHKIILNTALYKFYPPKSPEFIGMTCILNGLILLPFIMTFSPAGFLSDKFPKNRIMKISAFLSIPITILITVTYWTGQFWISFYLLFFLALQSALYGPAKYGYLKELVGKEKLAMGNGLIQSVTIIAILLGTFIYSWFFEMLYVPTEGASLNELLKMVKYLGFLLVGSAAIEFILTYRLPSLTKVAKDLKFKVGEYVKMGYLKKNLSLIGTRETLRLCIIGLSVFWAVNQVLLAIFQDYFKETVGNNNAALAMGALALGGLGTILGSVLAGKISRNFIELGIIPIGAVGMSVCLFVFPLLKDPIIITATLVLYGIAGGFFIVPLNSLLQFSAGEKDLGTVLAGSNFVQKVTMMIFLVGTYFLTSTYKLQAVALFNILFVVTLIGTIFTVYKIPQSLIRYLVRFAFSRRYKVEVLGLNNIPSKGGVMLVGNHVSFLDWALLAIACPRPIRFVMHKAYYNKWYLKKFMKMANAIPIARGDSKAAIDEMQESLRRGQIVAIFPEGHLSHSGQINQFKSGFERAVKDTGAQVIPFYLGGLWGSRMSNANLKYKKTVGSVGSRAVTVCFGKPMPDTTTSSEAKQAVMKTSIYAWYKYSNLLNPIPESFLQSAIEHGKETAVIDADGTELTYQKLLTAVFSFKGKLEPILKDSKNCGILLPPSPGGVIANLSSMMLGKTVVNLNYTSDPKTLDLCAQKGHLSVILTSKRFVKKLEQRGIDLHPLFQNRNIVYLEDIKKSISKSTLLINLISVKVLPFFMLRQRMELSTKMSDTAAILFSSGSEGNPKGIQLSHTNIMGNIKQTASVINANPDDSILCTLPLFHAFGLTISTLLPLVEGIPIVCQPDPTDAKTIGQLVGKHKITMLFGTSTFFRIYARSPKIDPVMFSSLRLIVAGAEKLQDEVRVMMKQKFGKEIYEGYGTTETTPVASVNLPDVLFNDAKEIQVGSKPGSVGLPLPGSQVRIVDPETLEPLETGEPGLILIGGTQIMKGYLDDEEKTNSVIVEQDGIRWYKSGDRGKIDEEGFLIILDRYSRFAKIGGEMISLTAVEQNISKLFTDEDDLEFVCSNLPDAAKGEKIILLYSGKVEKEKIKETILKSDVNPLMKPKEIYQIKEIPKLGTGKTNLSEVKKLTLEMAA